MDKSQITEMIAKSALSAIPYVGGSIASILGDYMSIRKEERFNEFLQNYFDEINQKHEYIVNEYVRSEEFLDIFENILSDIMKTRTKQKRFLLKNLLVNSCAIPCTSYDRTEEFQHLIDVLSPLSLTILSSFYQLKEVFMDGEKSSIDKHWSAIKAATGINDESTLLDYIGELESRSLIESFKNNTYSTDGGTVIVADKPYITKKGILFFSYIIEQPAGAVIDTTNTLARPKSKINQIELDTLLGAHSISEEAILGIVNDELDKQPKIISGTSDFPPHSLKNGDFYIKLT